MSLSLSRVTIENTFGDALIISNSPLVQIQGSTLRRTTIGNGITIGAGDAKVLIRGSKISENGGHGIYQLWGSVTIIDSIVWQNGQHGLHALSANSNPLHTRILDSQFLSNAETGVMFEVGSGGEGFLEATRLVSANNDRGLFCSAAGSVAQARVLINDSQLSQNTTGPERKGLYCIGVNVNVVLRNSIVTGNETGIQQALSATVTTCGNNLIQDNLIADVIGSLAPAVCLD